MFCTNFLTSTRCRIFRMKSCCSNIAYVDFLLSTLCLTTKKTFMNENITDLVCQSLPEYTQTVASSIKPGLLTINLMELQSIGKPLQKTIYFASDENPG